VSDSAVVDLRRLALGDKVAAGVAGAGAKVDHEIGAADGVFVVLDHEDSVTEIAQMFSEPRRRALSRRAAYAGSSRT